MPSPVADKNKYFAALFCLSFLLGQAAKAETVQELNSQAQKLMQKGNASGALTLEAKAIKIAPQDPSPHLTLTAIYLRLGDLRQAYVEAGQAVRLDPKSPVAHFNIANILQAHGNLMQACQEYRSCLTLLNLRTPATDRLPTNLALSASQKLAICLALAGDTKESVSILENLSHQYPKNADVWLNLSKAYLSAGNKSASAKALEKALNINPNHYDALLFSAEQQEHYSNFKLAYALAERLPQIEPKNPLGYLFLTEVKALGFDDPDACRTLFNQAVKQIPNDGKLYLSMAKLFDQAASKKVANARELAKKWLVLSEDVLKQAIKADPEGFDTNFEMGQLYLAKHEPGEALPYFRQCLKVAPENPQAQNFYHEALRQNQDWAGAFRDWMHSLFNWQN